MRTHSFSQAGIIVECGTFEKQMGFLKSQFNVITLSEFCRHIENRMPFRKYACLITFDDGWRDNVTHALPVLKKHGLAAVVFLPVNFIGTAKRFWQEELTAILSRIYRLSREGGEQERRLRDLLAGYHMDWILDVPEDEVRDGISKIIQAKKAEQPEAVNEFLRQLSKSVAGNPEGEDIDGFMDWQDVDRMTAEGITFGSHGMDHRILTKIPLAEAGREIAESKKILEEKMRTPVVAFSYPNGDYSPDIVDFVRNNGYQVAFSTKNGYVDSSSDPFALKRINIHNDATKNIPLFLSTILGIF